MEARPPAPKSPRWSAERRAFPPLRDAGRFASARARRVTQARSRASCVTISALARVLCHAAGQPGAAAPGRLSALRPPLVGGGNLQKPRAPNAPRERDVLFDIVRTRVVVGRVHRDSNYFAPPHSRPLAVASLCSPQPSHSL